MTDLLEGIFFHRDGNSPRDVLDRILDDKANPRLDDPFAQTFKEMRDRIQKARDRKREAELRARNAEGDLERLEEAASKLVAARDRFFETGEVDEALIPACDEVVAEKVREQKRKACDAAEETLRESIPEGWQVDRKRANDTYVYITLRRRREPTDGAAQSPSQDCIREKVRKVIETYKDEYRALLPLRFMALPQNPAAP